MFKFAKRATSAVIAGAVVLGSLTVYPGLDKGVYAAKLGDEGFTADCGYNATDDTNGTVNYSTVLGRATAYGVVADSWELLNHAETNFALNKFINTNNNVLEPDLAGTAPLSFVVGDIDGKLRFGNNTYEGANVKYVIHTSEELKEDYDLHQGNGYIHSDAKIYVDNKNDKVKLSVDTTYTSASATNMISHVATESANLATKETTIDVAKYEATHSGLTLNEYVIDLDVDEYEGKAVYINVPKDSKLGEIFSSDSAYSRSVLINKRSSTNVVFNFIGWETVYAKGPCVHIADKEIDYTKNNITYVSFEGKDYLVPKTTAGHYKNNTLVEEEIVDKVIFNMPDAKTVGVLEGGGAFLAPKAENSSVLSTSSGWIVVNGKFTNPNCEWHFLNGTRAESLYFSGQKKFTKSFTKHSADDPEIELYDDTTVEYDVGDFAFELYKSNSDFELGEKIDDAVVTKSGSFEFKPLKDLEEGETYYYVIKESNKSIKGITNNDGEIDIKVEVFEKDDHETGYKVTSYKYLTSEDKANNKPFRTNDGVTAQELEFYFGSVYNLITGSLKLKKTVEGKSSSETFNFYVKGEDGYWYDNQGKPYSDTEPCAISVPANGDITIDNLPVQKYTITEEDPVAKAGKSYEFNTGSTIKAEDVEVESGKTVEAELINKYDYVTGNLIVEKTATDNNNEAVAGTFKFTIQDESGNYLQSDEKTFGEKEYKFLIDSNSSRTFEDLPLGTYTVTEDTDSISVKGFTFTSTGSTTEGTGIVTKTVTDDSKVSLVNKFTKDLGSLKVSKTATDNNNDAVGGTFKFTVKNSDGEFLQSDGKTFGEKEYKFEVAGGSSKTFADLPVGDYTVTEDETSTAVEGYTYATSGNKTSATETVVKDEIVEAKLINKYTKDLGTLTVVKSAADNNDQPVAGTFKFSVKNGAGQYLQSDEKTFAENEYLFEVAAGSSKTFTNLPVGKYEVKEDTGSVSVTGYTFNSEDSITGGSGTVSKEATTYSTVGLFNQFTKDVGKLTVKKTATDNNNAAVDGTYKFTVKNSAGMFLQVDKKSFADAEHEFSVKTGETVTFEGLPVDTYTVTENTASAAVTGYTYAATGNTTTVSKDVTKNGTANVELINKYTRDVGNLTVKKTATDNNNEGVEGTFKFTVKNSKGQFLQSDEKTFADGEYKFSVASGSSKTFTGLPTGTYTVAEDANAVAVPGYTYATSGNTTSVNADVVKGETATAGLVNKYTKDVVKGKLNVTKSVDITNADGITLPTEYTFSVSNGTKWLKTDGSLSDTEVTYTVEKGKTVNFVDVPEGTYTVTEKTPEEIFGYSLEITYTNNGAKIESSTDNKTITITNTYTKDAVKGKLKVEKVVDTTGAAGIAGVPTEFKFYVQDETNKYLTQDAGLTDVETTYTVAAGSSFNFTNVPEGTYTVTEVTPDSINGYSLDIVYSNNGAAIASSTDEKTITITNTYTKDEVKGKLNVTKAVDTSAADGITLPENYTFSVSNGSKWLKTDGSLSDTEVTYTVTKDGTVNFVDVPEGTYTVTEKTPDAINGYSLEITYTNNGAQIQSSTDNKTITITNTYKKDTTTEVKGKLNVTKSVDTSAADGITLPANYTFSVSNGSKWLKTDGSLSDTEVTYTVAKDGTVNFVDVPEGTYTVTEKTPDAINGYSLEITYTNNGAQIQSSTDNKTITITNTYKKDTTTEVKGKLNVTKSVDTSAADGITLPTSYTFSVSNGSKWLKTDGSLSDTEVTYTVAKDGTVNFVDVPEGTYTVTEKTPDAINGYSLEITYTNNGAKIESSTDNKTITITNTYKKDTTTEVKGKLNVTKSVDTSAADGITLPANYTFSVSNGSKWLKTDGSLSDTEVTYTVAKDGTVNFVDVPEGTYTVTEKTPDTISGYSLEITYTNNGAQIQSSTDEKTITITNTYRKEGTTPTETGELTVTKSVGGSIPSGFGSSYKFRVKCGDQYVQADGKLGSEAYEFTVDASSSTGTIITDLELGKTYVVEEVDITGLPTGYTCSTTYTDSNKAVLDTNNKKASVKITNTFIDTNGTGDSGSLTVSKKVSGSTASSGMPSSYAFYIKCEDKYVQEDGSLGDDIFEFSVGPNKSFTINNLELDKEYEVVEVKVTGLPSGYSCETSYSNGGKVKLDSESDSGSVLITNTYSYKAPTPAPTTGKLKITKKLGENSPSSASSKVYSFTISGQGITKTVEVKAGQSVTVEDLKPGTYTVTENKSSAAIPDYTLTVTGEGTASVEAGEIAEKTITNTYKSSTTPQPQTGVLRLTKTIGGDAQEQDLENVTMCFIVKSESNGKYLMANGDFSDTEVTIKLTELDHTSGTMTWSKEFTVPLGKYTVTESNTTVYPKGSTTAYTFDDDTSVTSATVEVKADSTASAPAKLELKNNYKKDSTESGFDVQISKQDVAHNAIANATLELRCVSGYDLSNVTVVKTSNGSPITYTLSQDKTKISFDTPENDSAIIKGLRAGEYELEETVIPKAFLKADTIKFTLRPDGSVEDSAGNVIVAGSPIVMIDKADPTYGQGHNTPVPATGENTSPYTLAGLAILVLAAACFTGTVVYRKKKRA